MQELPGSSLLHPFSHALCLEIFAFNGRRDGSGEGGGNKTSRRFTFHSDFLDAPPLVWPAWSCPRPLGPLVPTPPAPELRRTPEVPP